MTPQFPKSVCTLLICICAATMTLAQQVLPSDPQTATIIGTVLDVNGGTVPKASVVLQGPAPDDHRALVAQDNGFFKLDGVKPGIPYHVIVSARGFANWASNGVIVEPGQFFILTGITLRVATVQATVTVVPAEQLAVEQVKSEEKQRILGVIPNFYVVYDRNAVPLTAKLKFQLALRASVDPVTIAGFGLSAGIDQLGDYPSYGQGADAYGQRLGATFAGGYTNILVGGAVLPSLLHQDPRYFYQGTGTAKSRLLHALSIAFVTKADNGHQQVNYSSIGGDLASGAIANAYYPSKDRGPGLVFSSALIGAGGRMVSAVIQEFVLRKFTSQHGTQDQASKISQSSK